jgi:enamine deaminase RidA (YjgF/YER057c/UK114 family)
MTPQPWPRTGPGTATDGKQKFDLSTFEQAYFDRSPAMAWCNVRLLDARHSQIHRKVEPMTALNEQDGKKGSVQYINPNDLPKNPAFTQVVAVTGPVKTVYVGMQNSVDASRTIVGKGDIAAQTVQTLKNLSACLNAAGAQPEHLVHWNIYVAQGQPIQPAFEAGMRWWGDRPHAPANSVIIVPGFTPPDFLVGIDAIAVVPLEA